MRRCRWCGASNPATATWCGQCLRRFDERAPDLRDVMAPGLELAGNGGRRGRARSGATMLVLSMLLPGAGHAYAGLAPEGIARGVLYLWTLGMAIVLTGRTGAPGAGLVRGVGAIFGAAAALVWAVSLAEARRITKGDRVPILPGRALTWASLALTLLLFVGLTVSIAGR